MNDDEIKKLAQKIISNEDFTDDILIDLILMGEEEIKRLIISEEMKGLAPNKKVDIIELFIKNSALIQELVENKEFTKDFKWKDFKRIFEKTGEDFRVQKLQDENFCKERGIRRKEKIKVLTNLGVEKTIEILSDETSMMKRFGLTKNDIIEILLLCSDEVKIRMILKGIKMPGNIPIVSVIRMIEFGNLIGFIKEHRDFLQSLDINLYQITSFFSIVDQLKFISEFENIGLSMNEKMQILSTLKQEAKEQLDVSGFPKEYITALNNSTISTEDGNIMVKVDFNEDLERYRGLDEALYINPMQLTDEEKGKLDQLFEICPKIRISDDLDLGKSTIEEYKTAEKWIEYVFQQINPDWTTIQKIAYIDWAIGKRISFSPDCDTEVFNARDAKALWKIISSGYGVCNGIAQVEAYMLSRLGVKVEMVYAERHAFLKVIDIEIPCLDGKTIKGDTIIDPTWNLAEHRYGAMPQNFCNSYEEIRKHDIDFNGVDSESHKNDELLNTPTLNLDSQSLKAVFKSIGVANKEGEFPIKDFIYKSVKIDYSNFPAGESIKKQLDLVAEYCPEFATCQNSTAKILSSISFNQRNLNFTRCVVNRVYAKADERKRPILYVYVLSPELGKKFYFADSETNQFIELQQKEFEERFECYQMDLEKNGGQRPWEESSITQNKVEEQENPDDEQTV